MQQMDIHAEQRSVVEVTIGWGGGELQGTEADVRQGRVADVRALVGVLEKLVDGEGGTGLMGQS